MKKPVLLVVTAVILLFACKKDQRLPDAQRGSKKYSVALRVVFDDKADARTVSSSTPDLVQKYLPGHGIRYIYYSLFDTTDRQLRSWKVQKYTDSTFGTISDSLPPGGFYAFILASTNELTYLPEVLLAGRNWFARDSITEMPDLFVKKVVVDVADSGFAANVVLNRVVGKLTVDLKDSILLAKGAQIRVNVYPQVWGYNAWNDSFANFDYPSATYFNETWFLPAPEGRVMMNVFFPFKVTITALSATGEVIKQKSLDSVRCYRNKITRIRGTLFDTPSSSFSISVDDKWDEDTVLVRY